MKIIFTTNLDNYKTNCFPDNLTLVPRIGDSILVREVFIEYFRNKKLPTQLVVTNVIWSDKGVLCELWYKEIDVEFAKLNKVNLF